MVDSSAIAAASDEDGVVEVTVACPVEDEPLDVVVDCPVEEGVAEVIVVVADRESELPCT